MRSNLRHSFGNTGLGWCWNTDNRVQSGVRVLRDVVLGSLEKLWNCGKIRIVDKFVNNEEIRERKEQGYKLLLSILLTKWILWEDLGNLRQELVTLKRAYFIYEEGLAIQGVEGLIFLDGQRMKYTLF